MKLSSVARRPIALSLAAVAGLCASAANAQVVSVNMVQFEGQAVAGSTIATINSPFTDDLGRMASIAVLADARRVIIDENLVVVFDSATVTTPVLTGNEGTMGISTNGYIYSPSIDGQDGVFANGGKLLRQTDPAPGLPGLFATFSSRPTMAGPAAYWVSGTATTSGGPTSQRVFYGNPTPGTPGATALLLKGGDTYGGLTIGAQGIQFGYGVSENGLHRAHVLTATGVPTTSDGYVAVDNVLVAREGNPILGSTWTDAFRIPSVNNSGTYLVAGDTNLAATQDEVVISNAGPVLQEGQIVNGFTLTGTANAISINNRDQIAVVWGTTGNKALMVGPLAGMVASGKVLIKINDLVDTNNDTVADYTVVDLDASNTIGPGMDLANDGRVFVEVSLRPIGGTSANDFDAILRFTFFCIADVDDGTGSGTPDGGVGIEDLLYYLGLFEAGSVAADTDDGNGSGSPDGGVGIEDLLFYLSRFEAGC